MEKKLNFRGVHRPTYVSYDKILNGQGFGLSDAHHCIQTAENMVDTNVEKPKNDNHHERYKSLIKNITS